MYDVKTGKFSDRINGRGTGGQGSSGLRASSGGYHRLATSSPATISVPVHFSLKGMYWGVT
jgi:hypothetical protein